MSWTRTSYPALFKFFKGFGRHCKAPCFFFNFKVFQDNEKEQEYEFHLRSVYAWRDEWKKKDPACTGRITAKDFVETIVKAPFPAGFGSNFFFASIKLVSCQSESIKELFPQHKLLQNKSK